LHDQQLAKKRLHSKKICRYSIALYGLRWESAMKIDADRTKLTTEKLKQLIALDGQPELT